MLRCLKLYSLYKIVSLQCLLLKDIEDDDDEEDYQPKPRKRSRSDADSEDDNELSAPLPDVKASELKSGAEQAAPDPDSLQSNVDETAVTAAAARGFGNETSDDPANEKGQDNAPGPAMKRRKTAAVEKNS